MEMLLFPIGLALVTLLSWVPVYLQLTEPREGK